MPFAFPCSLSTGIDIPEELLLQTSVLLAEVVEVRCCGYHIQSAYQVLDHCIPKVGEEARHTSGFEEADFGMSTALRWGEEN